MKIDGQLIKKVRKQKNMTQGELAKGICTQATVSNMENKNICDSLDILSKLCIRLDLKVEECMEVSEEKQIRMILNDVEKLCLHANHKKGFEILKTISDDFEFTDNRLYNKFSYYKGITYLLGGGDIKASVFYLYQGSEYERYSNIYNVLCLNSLGILYEIEEELSKAKKYYDKSLGILDDCIERNSLKACLIYYNSAKFYSEIKEYKKSIQLCEEGIEICKNNQSGYLLDFLVYEKAYNKYMLEGNIAVEYMQAYYMAKFWGNKTLLKVIEEDIKNNQNNINCF